MAKSKKSSKKKKTSVKVEDLQPEANPTGGATYSKLEFDRAGFGKIETAFNKASPKLLKIDGNIAITDTSLKFLK